MTTTKLLKLEEVLLLKHPTIKEKQIQDKIAEDPSILGLGDLILKDKERIQPKAGRLDFLLQDPDTKKRYTIEVQLGQTDPSHIIRTLEYYDIERKRFPQFEHCAVIVAEEITTRFLNVISMFNGNIPLIAIQMKAYKLEDSFGLTFTKILDEVNLGYEEDEGEVQETVDRDYWLKRSSSEIMKLSDDFLSIVKSISPNFDYKYNKAYVGLATDGYVNNFVTVGPRRKHIIVTIKMTKSDEIKSQIEESGLDFLDYSAWGAYRVRVTKEDFKENKEFLTQLIQKSWEENNF